MQYSLINKKRSLFDIHSGLQAIKNAILETSWNQLMFILPVSVAQWVWTPVTFLPVVAPGLFEFCWQQYAALAIFDAEYYLWHSTHHKVSVDT